VQSQSSRRSSTWWPTCRYWLKLEDIALWYPCFVNGNKLLPFVETAWQTRGLSTECWWKPASMSCEEYYGQAKLPNGMLRPLKDMHKRDHVVKRDRHDQGTTQKWEQFYDQEMADMIYTLYKPDFERFGYARLILAEAQ
jgi:hypothetical protein